MEGIQYHERHEISTHGGEDINVGAYKDVT